MRQIRVVGFYPASQEAIDGAHANGQAVPIGRCSVNISCTEPTVIERRYQKDEKWESFTIATVNGGTITVTVEIKTAASGTEFVQSPVVLTYEEKQQLMIDAAKLAKQLAERKPAERLFGEPTTPARPRRT